MSRKLRAHQQRHILHQNANLWRSKFRDGQGDSFLGLDFSLTSTGMAALNIHGEPIGTISVTSEAKDGTTRERISKISEGFRTLVKEFQPRVISMEDINVGTHINSTIQLAMVYGVINNLINEMKNTPYLLFCNVSSLKSFAAKDSAASKSHMLMEVYAKWGVKLSTDDEADAFSAAKIAYRLPAFFEAYAEAFRQEERDLPTFLMDICKSRHDGFYKECEKRDIEPYEADVIVGLMTGSANGGAGMKHLKENDTAYYYGARKELREL